MNYAALKSFISFWEIGNLIVILLVFCAVFLDFPKSRYYSFAKTTVAVITFLLLFMVIGGLGETLLRPLENAVPPAPLQNTNVDGIILLTGDENERISMDRDTPIAGAASQRHIQLARLAQQFPEAKILVTGSSRPQHMAADYGVIKIVEKNLAAMGVDSGRVIFEPQAVNTHENALFGHAVARPQVGERWALVTSAYHMPRAVLSFEKVGWTVIPAPTDYMTASRYSWDFRFSLSQQLRMLTIAMHEYVGLLAYRILGWVDKLWV